jgi:hypothetical protein
MLREEWCMGSGLVIDQRPQLNSESIESSIILKFNQDLLKRIN